MITADNVKAIAIGGAVLGALVLGYKAYSKVAAVGGGVVDVLGEIAALPGRAVDAVTEGAKQGGGAWKDGWYENPDYGHEGRNYEPKYNNPLINDQGYDFGQLSG